MSATAHEMVRGMHDQSKHRVHNDHDTPSLSNSSGQRRQFGVRRRRFGGETVENARDGRDNTTTTKMDVDKSRLMRTTVNPDDFNFSDQQNAGPKYIPTPVHRIVRPGASIVGFDREHDRPKPTSFNQEEDRLSKYKPPPRTQTAFLNNIASKKAPAARTTSSVRVKQQRQSLESASAPTEPKSTTNAAKSTRPPAEWVPPKRLERSANDDSVHSSRSKRVRVELTPPPRVRQSTVATPTSIGSTRASPRLASQPDRNRYGIYDGDESPPKSQSDSNRAVVARAQLRRTTRTPKPRDGTEDMPIHLSDSSEDDGDDDAALSSLQTATAEAETSADHDITHTSNPGGFELPMPNHRVYIGTFAGRMDLILWKDCMWLTAIRGVGKEWKLGPSYKIPFSKFQRVLFYRLKPDVHGDRTASDPAERVLSSVSFLAIQFAYPLVTEKTEWKNFYDPNPTAESTRRSDDVMKRYFVVISNDDDDVGANFGTFEDMCRGRRLKLTVADDGDEVRRIAAAIAENDAHFIVTPRPSIKRRKRKETTTDEGEIVQLTYPLPPCSIDVVTITRQDVARLQPRQYLNDNIIDYYFKRLMLEDFGSNAELKKNVLFLSSHFYSRLRSGRGTNPQERLAAGYQNVKTWLTRSDLFGKCLVFVPINKDTHWSMAVIVNPRCAGMEEGSFEDEQAQTTIALLDPLGSYHSKLPIQRHLKSFLSLEWDRVSQPDEPESSAPPYRTATVSTLSVKAPLQDNGFDCGVFILNYARVMLRNFARILDQSRDPTATEGFLLPRAITDDELKELIMPDAFGSGDITAMRRELGTLIAEDTQRYEAMFVDSP